MATGDAAAAAGLVVVPATESVRNGATRLNQRGDEIAAVMGRVGALEKRQRVWQFPRTGNDNDFWAANSWGNGATGVIANAPAGEYLIDCTSVYGAAAGGDYIFRFELQVNGTRVMEFRSDADNKVRPLSYAYSYVHSGGNLSVLTRLFAPSNVDGYIERRGTGVRVTYLGAR